jgi:hypothetical protein
MKHQHHILKVSH